MLFNSYEFILAFLPITLLVFYYLAENVQPRVAIAWLVAASLFFYGWWNPAYVALLIGSILFNYSMGLVISKKEQKIKSRALLIFGVICNLGLLGYYKYANFFVDNINWLTSGTYQIETIILPLAISFFTFQQIAYLVDAYSGGTREYDFLQYCLFVTFFPQLIAGPIVHHREMMPQFDYPNGFRLNHNKLATGLTIFAIGLCKKILIADNFAKYANRVFDSTIDLSFFEAWLGAIAYSFQIYFDFSGYSEMAIGLGLMFGIRLPINFYSPYRAGNIIEFWRHWHMTLSRFLRDYLYIPLGGSRKGKTRRYINLMLTMVIGGLWHGAGWTFVIWGGLHGIYLIINHTWHSLRTRSRIFHNLNIPLWFGRILTFTVVTFAWVFFRAEDTETALKICHSMLGFDGVVLPEQWFDKLGFLGVTLSELGINFAYMHKFNAGVMFILIPIMLYFLWKSPNTLELFSSHETAITDQDMLKSRISWSPTRSWAVVIAIFGFIAMLNLTRVNEFIYFQF